MADVESEISRILDVKCRAFLTSKDDFFVAAKTDPKHVPLSYKCTRYNSHRCYCPAAVLTLPYACSTCYGLVWRMANALGYGIITCGGGLFLALYSLPPMRHTSPYFLWLAPSGLLCSRLVWRSSLSPLTPPFLKTLCMVTHIARVWINRVRLPVLYVVS